MLLKIVELHWQACQLLKVAQTPIEKIEFEMFCDRLNRILDQRYNLQFVELL